MTGDELRQLILTQSVTLSLDSNAIFRGGLRSLAEKVQWWNLRPGPTIPIVIPSLCEAEHRRQEQIRLGDKYDMSQSIKILQDFGVEIVSFDHDDAAIFAKIFGGRFLRIPGRNGTNVHSESPRGS
jgi:hypothetical protein